MDKVRATKAAIDLTSALLSASTFTGAPTKNTGESIADCIEALASRLEKMDT